MIPLRVCLKGFMSYREEQELRFDESPLYVLAGPNGAGKSTLFDAIAFALYGRSRAGARDRDLINHESDALHVEYDFRIDQEAYRVRRTLTLAQSRKGKDRDDRLARSTRLALRLTPEPTLSPAGWHKEPQPDTESEAGFTLWREHVFGISYETFTSSVMLLQGESEKLLKADPRGRHEILSELINLSAFQRLHEKVDRLRKKEAERKDLHAADVRRMPEVSEDALLAAREAVAALATRVDAMEAEVLLRQEVLVKAGQWQRLVEERHKKIGQQQQDQAILSRADEIQEKHAAFQELTQVLGILGQLVEQGAKRTERGERVLALEQEIVQIAPRRNEAAARLAELEAQATALGEEVSQLKDGGSRVLQELVEVSRAVPRLERLCILRPGLSAALSAIHDLGEELLVRQGESANAQKEAEQAEQTLAQARSAEQALRDRQTERSTQCRHVQDHLLHFAEAAKAPSCELCDQPLSREYAAHRREALQAALGEAQALLEEAKKAYHQGKRVYKVREEEFARAAKKRDQALAVQSEIRRRQKEAEQASAERQREIGDIVGKLPAAYRKFAADPHAEAPRVRAREAELSVQQEELLQKQTARGSAYRDACTQRDQARKTAHTLDAVLHEKQDQRSRLLVAISENEDARRSALCTLPLPWRERAEHLGPTGLADLQQQERQLSAYKGLFAELLRAQKGGLAEQIESLSRQIDEVPEQARRNPEEVGPLLNAAQNELQVLRGRHRDGTKRQDDLIRQAEEWARKQKEYDQSARDHALYVLLGNLLGPKGLQLRLVRQAEEAIVREANDTLHKLSRGRIRLELRHSDEEVSEKALDLLVYNEDTGSRPIPVALASGSQRFRVAISLALAIGHYLGREARRVESVIIDEGFGCLDRNSRDDTVEVLHALKDHLSRIILVSHQEEFSGRFTQGYQIRLRDRASVPVPFDGA